GAGVGERFIGVLRGEAAGPQEMAILDRFLLGFEEALGASEPATRQRPLALGEVPVCDLDRHEACAALLALREVALQRALATGNRLVESAQPLRRFGEELEVLWGEGFSRVGRSEPFEGLLPRVTRQGLPPRPKLILAGVGHGR